MSSDINGFLSDGCFSYLWVSTYIYFMLTSDVDPSLVESLTCSLRCIFICLSVLCWVVRRIHWQALCLSEHCVSSVVWRIGQSIRALRNGGHRVCILFALRWSCTLGIGMMSILCILGAVVSQKFFTYWLRPKVGAL